jgi:hypothetical protein
MSSVLAEVLQSPSPVEQMVWLLRLRILIPAISVAARLGVADQIGEEPREAEDIARAVNAHPQSLYRLLRCLASAGVFEQVGPRRFAHSALSRMLVSGGPASLREFAMMYTSEWLVRALDGLEYSIRTGEGCLARVLGKPGYEWVAERPDEAALVNRAMAAYSRTMQAGVVDTLDQIGNERALGKRHEADRGTESYLLAEDRRPPQQQGDARRTDERGITGKIRL